MPFRAALAFLLLLYVASSPGDERAPGRATIHRLLAEQQHWTLIFETVRALEPTAAATRFPYVFHMRDGRLIGEWGERPAEYSCPFEIELRDDGFAFKHCGPYDQPLTHLQYDPRDARYPFKRVDTPSKWWMERRARK